MPYHTKPYHTHLVIGDFIDDHLFSDIDSFVAHSADFILRRIEAPHALDRLITTLSLAGQNMAIYGIAGPAMGKKGFNLNKAMKIKRLSIP